MRKLAACLITLCGCSSYAADPTAPGAGGIASQAGAGASPAGSPANPAGGSLAMSGAGAGATQVPGSGAGKLGFQVPPDSEPDAPRPACLRTVAVQNDDTLQAALLAVKPGDCIELADGNYAAFKLTAVGTAEAPIVLFSKNPLGAHINEGQLQITSSAHVVLEGLVIATDGSLKLIDSEHCRFTRCKLELTVEDDWVVIFGNLSHDNRIDHSELGPKPTPGPFIVVGQEDTMSVGDRFDHNYFHDNGPPAVNEKESVRIGWSEISDRVGGAVVEYNLFENCDGDPEIVSVKTHQNIVRYNTVRTSTGVLSLRHGDGSFLYGNYILGGGKSLPCTDRDGAAAVCDTGGIRVYGKNHVIFDNYIQGTTGAGFRAPLALDGSDGSAKSDHHQVLNAQVVANTLVDNVSGIEIGANYEKAPKDSIVAYNLVSGEPGRLFRVFKADATINLLGNVFWAGAGADVGVAGLVDTQALQVDPLLAKDGELWRLTEGSAAIDGARELEKMLPFDIEGQPRDIPDIGADELSAKPVLRRPLSASDVGPSSAE